MNRGDIVFLPISEGYVKYIIKKIFDGELIVSSYKTHQLNCVNYSDVIDFTTFVKMYNNEEIYE